MAMTKEAEAGIGLVNERIEDMLQVMVDWVQDDRVVITFGLCVFAIAVCFVVRWIKRKFSGRIPKGACPLCKGKVRYTRGEVGYAECSRCLDVWGSLNDEDVLGRQRRKQRRIAMNIAVFNKYRGGIYNPGGVDAALFEQQDHESGFVLLGKKRNTPPRKPNKPVMPIGG